MPATYPSAPARKPRRRTRRDQNRLRSLLLLFLIVLVAFAACSHFRRQVTLTTLEEDWITLDLLPVNKYSRPEIPLEHVNGIVVHYTGNPNTTAEQTKSYFSNLATTGETYASSHFIIGMDGTILQCVPLNEEAYCSNSRNVDTVSIECCHPDKSGKFSDKTYDSLVKLVRYLASAYRLTSDDVIRHYDVTGKLCPIYYVEHEDAWIAFKEAVFEDS
jgi:N-acetylmuramoyl-L-alanine amidase CwlA